MILARASKLTPIEEFAQVSEEALLVEVLEVHKTPSDMGAPHTGPNPIQARRGLAMMLRWI